MRPRDRAALILVAIAVTFSVLAVGGAPRWAACVGALLGVASAVPYVTSSRTSSKPSPLLLPLAVAAGLTALQLLPLPRAIAEQLVPAKLALVTDNAAALDEPAPGWVMASYDPPATLVELAKLLGYLGLAYTAVRLAAIRRARSALAMIVAGVATAAALITLAHHALNAEALYGLVEPAPDEKVRVLGPLFGVNHLASLLSIGVPVALSLALASSGIARGGWLVAAATLVATTLLTGSRGGLLGLCAGLVVWIAVLVVQRRSGPHDTGKRASLVITVPGALIAICTVVLLAVVTAGDLAGDLERTSLDEIHEPHSKFQVWYRATTLVADNRWLGVGRGGFEAAFTRVSEVGDRTYTHAENDYLQVVIDWGLPGAAALVLALLTALRIAVRRWRHGPLEAGVIGGIASLIVHDVADFSLELPGVAMMTITAAAVLLPARIGAASTVSTERTAALRRRTAAIRGGVLAGLTAIIALAASPLARTVRADDARVGAEVDVAARLARARDAWRRHPADYILAGRVAEGLFLQRDPRSLKVISRGLALNPMHSGLHRLAGRVLAQTNAPEQAAVELAIAARLAVDVRPIVGDVLQLFRTPAQIARALPTEPRQSERIVEALKGHSEAALAYALRVAERHPGHGDVQYLVARTALEVKRTDLAVPAGRAAWAMDRTARNAMMLARALDANGDRPGGIAVLEEAVEHSEVRSVTERLDLLFSLADLQTSVGNYVAARAALERAVLASGNDPVLLTSVHLRLATVEDLLGHHNQAAWERQEARRLGGDNAH